jgi:hypothetical protein
MKLIFMRGSGVRTSLARAQIRVRASLVGSRAPTKLYHYLPVDTVPISNLNCSGGLVSDSRSGGLTFADCNDSIF